MNVSVKQLPQSRVELTVEIAADELEHYLDAAVRTLSRTHPVKGFRPGHAPRAVFEQHVGKKLVFEEAANTAVRESYVKAILEHKLETVADPTLEIVEAKPEKPLRFRATVAVIPDITLPDYHTLTISARPVVVEEGEVASALKTLQKSRAAYTTVARSAQKGDRVEIDFTSTINGVPLEDGTSKQHPLIIGEGHFMDGFEEKLIGMREGDQKSFSITAPQTYPRENMRGKKIDFEVTMRLVQSVELPPLNDEFAQRLGSFQSLNELTESIRSGLTEEKVQRERERSHIEMIERILAETQAFEVPDVLIERELKKMEDEFIVSLARIGINREHYLAHLKKSMDDLRADWRTQAEKRVKAALLLERIAERENVSVSDEEISHRVGELVKNIPENKVQSLNIEQIRAYVQGILRNEKVFAKLEESMLEKL